MLIGVGCNNLSNNIDVVVLLPLKGAAGVRQACHVRSLQKRGSDRECVGVSADNPTDAATDQCMTQSRCGSDFVMIL